VEDLLLVSDGAGQCDVSIRQRWMAQRLGNSGDTVAHVRLELAHLCWALCPGYARCQGGKARVRSFHMTRGRARRDSGVRRNGAGEDIAAAVLFFATAPHFITGQILVVDGGLSL